MVKIYTETTCDLSLELLDELAVGVIPMKMTLDGVEYLDRFEMTSQSFFAKLAESKSLPTTSQITPDTYMKLMTGVKEREEEALFAVFSSALSGTYQSALIAQREVDYPRIKVVDTKAASGGQGLIVHELASRAREGATLEELEKQALWMADHIEHLVIVENLEMLKRGGRISSTAAFMGGVMNVKPLIHMESGKLIPYGKVKGQKKAIERIVQEMGNRCRKPGNQKIIISHGHNPEGARMLNQAIQAHHGVEASMITELGPIIASHTGQGVLGLFFFNDNE